MNSALPPELLERAWGEGSEALAASRSLFRDWVEPLGDSFTEQGVRAYVEGFAPVVARALPDWNARDLLVRYERVRRPRPFTGNPAQVSDVVVLSRTLQTVRYPDRVLRQMARIAGRVIVSVPNFGWYRHRLRMLRGRLPMGKDLPYSWYDSPNVRYTTLVDLQLLFDEVGLEVERTIPLGATGDPLKAGPRWANLLASTGVYVLRPAARQPD